MTAGQYNVGWTPFAGAPTVQIADLSGGAYDTPSIASFFGGKPDRHRLRRPELFITPIVDGWGEDWLSPLILDLDGSAFDDIIAGNAGPNVLDGGAGVDRLAGGPGGDVLIGGTGNDLFRFQNGLDAFNGSSNAGDFIHDFTPGEDKIQLNAAAFGIGSISPGTNFFTGASPGVAFNVPTLVYATTSGYFLYDPDGTGAVGAYLLAVLNGTPAIAAGDFAFY